MYLTKLLNVYKVRKEDHLQLIAMYEKLEAVSKCK